MAVFPGVLLMLCVGVGYLRASPVRTYDQRQQGELNIHAQLDNIVIVLVPTTNFDLFGLKGANRFGEKPDKNEILHFLQKPHKNDIDRYEIVKDGDENDIKEVSMIESQNVAIIQPEKNNEKEEEVVATVEEMKPDTTEKATDPPKSEATEDSPIKEHSTVGESVQELVFKVSVPEELKKKSEAAKDAEKPVSPKESPSDANKSPPPQDTTVEKQETSSEEPQKNEPSIEKESTEKKDTQQKDKEVLETPSKKLTIEDFIKPVAAKEEKTTQKPLEEPLKKSSGLVEGARREKVIRYKPESKWAPGLVDMLAAPRAKVAVKEVEEKQRFAALCAPGTWDTELKTCIMPGETRSRHELARFLEAMRFGIAVPAPKK